MTPANSPIRRQKQRRGKFVDFTGKVLRILPLREISGEIVVDAILADEREYKRVSFWGEHAEFVLRDVRVGDVLKIKNAYEFSGVDAAGSEPSSPAPVSLSSLLAEKRKRRDVSDVSGVSGVRVGAVRRLKVSTYSYIEKIVAEVKALRAWKPVDITVLAVARPEKGKVCVAGIDTAGNWLRPQSIYEGEMLSEGKPRFKNLCVSRIYVDAWRGRRARKEDRFFVHCDGILRELNEEERREFLEKHTDPSVEAVFKSGRTLGLIKPRRILRIHEERATKGERRGKRGEMSERERSHEEYIHISFQDASGRIYRKWSCRCSDFYKLWDEMRAKHRWTYKWRIRRMLRKNITYFAIGLTHTDYGVEDLEFGAYPMIVGVHIVKK